MTLENFHLPKEPKVWKAHSNYDSLMLSLFIYFTVNPIESTRSIIYSSVDESAVDSIAHVDAQIHYQLENGIV